MPNEARVRAQKQKFRHCPAEGVHGDCHRTAIAACLGLDRDEVPHFMEGGPATEPKAEIQAWLAARGLVGIDLIYPSETALDDILSSLAHLNPGVPFILGGQSKNGTNHSVVCLDGEIVCDPALDDAGIVGPMDDGYWWVTYFGARAIAALPAEMRLLIERAADNRFSNEEIGIGFRASMAVFRSIPSPPAPASQVLTEEDSEVIDTLRSYSALEIFSMKGTFAREVLAIIDRITNKDAEHG